MCRSRLWLLYWVSTQIRRRPALTRLDRAKSTSRYRPPNGTAGLARSAVSGASRLPAPPARTIARTRSSAGNLASPAIGRRGRVAYRQPSLVADTATSLVGERGEKYPSAICRAVSPHQTGDFPSGGDVFSPV